MKPTKNSRRSRPNLPMPLSVFISPLPEERYEDDIEARNPKSKDTPMPRNANSVNRGVSLMSPSTNDSVTHRSNPSQLKTAQLAANGGNQPRDDSTAAAPAKCSGGNTVAETMNRVTSMSFYSGVLSQFGCGVFAASSFAFCASDGKVLFETVLYRCHRLVNCSKIASCSISPN